MAPEFLMRGVNGIVFDEKCDVYSFAVVAFEIITGARPWQSYDHGQIAFSVGVSGLRPLDVCSPSVLAAFELAPAHVAPLVAQCWSKVPTDRPT